MIVFRGIRLIGSTMNIDERIEKLTERHEALTHSVELMIVENREGRERMEKLTERHEALAQSVELYIAETREWNSKAGALIVQVAESMNRLTRIVEGHEHRIAHLEGGTA